MKTTTLRQKLLLFLFLINVVATLSFTVNTYRSDRQNLLSGIDQELLSSARALPLMLPADYPDRAVTAAGIPAAEYNADLNRLSGYADAVGLTYLYSYYRTGGRIYTTSTNATPTERAKGTATQYWDLYDTPPPQMLDAFATGQVRFAEYTDSFGHFRSAFVPQVSPGGTRYLVGADISISFIDQRLRATLIRCVAIGVAIFLGVLLVSYVFIYRLSGPLIRLAAYTRQLAERNFAPDAAQQDALRILSERSRDEVGRLADSVRRMETRLGEYIESLKATTAAKERIESELKIARDIQQSILPHSFALPGGARAELHATMEAAKAVGGDLYDFFPLDERRLGLVVGDVSDKGVPAAFFMAVSVTLLRAHSSKNLAPAEVLTLVNRELCRHNDSMMFVTVFLAVLDLETGRLAYSNGGHNPPLLVRRGGKVETLPPTPGAAMGVFDDTVYGGAEAMLGAGDMMLLYTDGVTEAMDPDNRQYSLARLQALVARQAPEAGARAVVEGVMADVKTFVCGCAPSDDITIMVARRPA